MSTVLEQATRVMGTYASDALNVRAGEHTVTLTAVLSDADKLREPEKDLRVSSRDSFEEDGRLYVRSKADGVIRLETMRLNLEWSADMGKTWERLAYSGYTSGAYIDEDGNINPDPRLWLDLIISEPVRMRATLELHETCTVGLDLAVT